MVTESEFPTREQRYPKLIEALPTGVALTVETINYIYTGNVPGDRIKEAVANVILGFLGDALELVEQDLHPDSDTVSDSQ